MTGGQRRGAAETGAAARMPSVRPRRPRRPRHPPGTLPQTSGLPSAHTRLFAREMISLWRGIRSGHPRLARSAFFPEGAYLQLKAIAYAGSDYTERLLGDYALDIRAAHALLGRDPSAARLVRVEVPAAYAHWVPPNVCYNRDGYYEVANSRLLYRQHGQLRSLGIASMISWRGVWYVVHLGAILRSGAEGVVDEPAVGPGRSEPSSTC